MCMLKQKKNPDLLKITRDLFSTMIKDEEFTCGLVYKLARLGFNCWSGFLLHLN